MALEDDLILRNPFEFQVSVVLVNDSVTREAITVDQMRKFLNFVKEDEHFSRYYEAFYILFHTGMRISEFCGLTVKDLNMKEGKQCWYLYMNMLYKVKMKSFVAKSKKYLTFSLMIYQTDSEGLDWMTVWYALLMSLIHLFYKRK